MTVTNLTDARIGALVPHKTPYERRDARLRGFGVRVTPSGGKRFFVHCQHRGERVWKTVGDFGAIGVDEARSRAAGMLAAIRRGEAAPPRPEEALFEAVAETVFRQHERGWKPRTLEVNRCYLRKQLLPHFAGRPIAEIDRSDVRKWFASLRATPVAADRSMPVLSVIMREAEAMGLRPEGSNPCRGIRRYRRKGRERFLSDDELRRLSAVLRTHADEWPLQVAAIRLLLLTGCRKGEVLTLRWSDYREGRLFLRDGKTGPRTVWLSDPARAVLNRIERTGRWVFPASRAGGPRSAAWLHRVWWRIRAEAGLDGARLHDLRHTHASIALRQGETVLAIGRLLGHASAETTLKYTHPADAMARDAAETVGRVLGRGCAMPARERRKLTDAAVARLRPGDREYTVWDTRVPGLGVRVRPTGGKSWVMLVDVEGRAKRISLGPVSTMTVAEARRECHARRANPQTVEPAAPAREVPPFRDFVEGEWKASHFGRYRPSTRRGVSTALRVHILPALGSKRLDRIAPRDVRCWFDAVSRTAPGSANYALGVLRRIFNFAIARGYLETNPTRVIRPNRRPRLERFLSSEEIGRLHRALDDHHAKGRRAEADIIRLLLLTGCRRGEILGLRRSEVQGDMLVLADSKTGPRRVPLNSQARAILERQPRGDSPFVFPSPRDPSRPRSPDLSLWYQARREAGIEDVRLHDLRHTHASHAVMNGVPVPVVSRLLGHSNTRMTLRYAHLGDRDIERAAERVGQAIAKIMGLGTQLPPLDTSSGGSSG